MHPEHDFTNTWASARSACREQIDHERLADVLAAGVTPLEFHELTRARFRRAHKDHPTPHAYRRSLQYFHSADSQKWLRLFREHDGEPLPPRSPKDLRVSPGPYGIDSEHRLWTWHTPDFIALIDARARAYFGIAEGAPLHVNAWGAACRAYWREVGNAEWAAKKAAARERREAAKARTRRASSNELDAYLTALKAECAAMEAKEAVS